MEEEKLMDNGTKVRLIFYSIVFSMLFIACLVIPCLFTQSIYGPIVGGLIGLTIIGFVIIQFYPIWFEDYIKRFWEHQKLLEESKNDSKESETKTKEGCC